VPHSLQLTFGFFNTDGDAEPDGALEAYLDEFDAVSVSFYSSFESG